MFWLKTARRAVGRSKGVWLKNMAKFVVEFEWQGIGRDAISLINAEIGNILSSVAWRKVRSMLTKELEERPNLGMIKEIVALELKSSCAILKRKRDRRMMIKLRVGVAAFQIEVGRWQGRREHAKNVRVERWKTSATGCYSARPGTISGNPWWKKSASVMAFKGRVSPSRWPLFWPQHALIILFSTVSAQCGVADLVYDS